MSYIGYQSAPTAQYGPPPKHSGFGIASLVVGVIAMLLECVTWGGTFLVVSKASGSSGAPGEETAMAIGFGICGGVLIAVVGLILGIISFFIPNRKKVTGIIGTAINGLLVFGTIALMCLGMAAGAK